MRKISIAIPFYNRSEMVMETITPFIDDDRIDEILICDDCSESKEYNKLLKNTANINKVRVVKNVINHHVQHSKRNAISFCNNEWVIIVDNDNVMQKDFIDKLYAIKDWNENTIYHPAFASPNFDYRQFNGDIITKENVKEYTDHKIFVTLMNTNNYMVNRNEYLRIYEYSKECRGADGIYNNYNWLKAGNKIHIVKDLEYFHRVHPQSEFLREVNSNMKLIYYWLDKVRELK